MADKQSPIFSKTYDFVRWALGRTEKFPKNERFRLAKRLDDASLRFYELLLEATRPGRASSCLAQADLELDKIRLYARLCRASALLDAGQYEFAVLTLTEIGKLLGGWMKSLPGRAAALGETGKIFAPESGQARGFVEQQQ
ncbi:MAG: hypothetical protein OHK0031_15380 [Anaerolineales bacterium]